MSLFSVRMKNSPGSCVGVSRPFCGSSEPQWALFFFYLRVGFIVKLLRSDPPPHQVIPHGVSQGEVIVPGRGDVPVLHQGEVQVAVEALLQLRHVLHLHDAPDADLLALLLVGQRFRHGAPGLRIACSGYKWSWEVRRWHIFTRRLLLAPLLIGGWRGRARLKTRPFLQHQEVAAQTNYCLCLLLLFFFVVFLHKIPKFHLINQLKNESAAVQTPRQHVS